jgi:ribosomal protein L3
MPGQLGAANATIKNLRLVEVRDGATEFEKILLVEGTVPGHRGGMVIVQKA